MDSRYNPADHEEKIYSFWEKSGTFTATSDSNKPPFSIILPPPNANADLHVGHAMYVYEDILIRYNKLLGKEVLWLPGADHAGFETQFVFEKHLAKKDQSRFDFDRTTLFKMIWDFVMKNRGTMENQLRRLGFALDWNKMKFTMDEDVVKIVHKTFKKMFDEGLIYRDLKLVNYCWKDGTSFSDLEVEDKEISETATVEAEGGLFYIDYKIVGESGTIQVATTRPETMFGDAAIMVNPSDIRYTGFVGKKALIPIINREIPIIADEYVDPDFGTGAVKVTPLHDFNDFEVAKKHGLKGPQIIGFDGKLCNTGSDVYNGLRVTVARLRIVTELNLKAVKHKKVLKVCYKCGMTLQPLPKEQWFIKVRPLADKAIEAVERGDMKIYPTRFKKTMIDWLLKFHDWNISRQIVWGIQIPAYFSKKENKWYVYETPPTAEEIEELRLEQDSDTFDTWFSSSQWPFVTLMAQENPNLFEKFYPTSVMETGYDILPAWVVRMTMIGLYVTGEVPFSKVLLHGMVRDSKGLKMSKSKGNVVNPMDMVSKYGADALRATLIFQSKEGGDVNFTEDKIVGMRNYANKIWNIGRFIWLGKQEKGEAPVISSETVSILKELQAEAETVIKKCSNDIDSFKFSRGFDDMYEFLWHRFADIYIEKLKDEIRSGNIEVLDALEKVYGECLKIIHPFMPFVTEAVWKEFYGMDSSILDTRLHNR
ncbi:MAG: Valine--tRNA ligase [Microgenomates bacterium OLB22]|nr:MAG: Valine--tRNA ligase [Microgenomates bacterium OLB22]